MRSLLRHKGQITTEYLVVTLALVLALFIPWDGQQSAIVQVLQAVRLFHANSSFPLSLP